MRGVVLRFGVPVAAFVAGMSGMLPVAGLGLIVSFTLVGPLSLLAGTLLAALAAGWVGNLACIGRSRSRLLAVLGYSCIGSVVAVLAGGLLLFAPRLIPVPFLNLNLLAVLAVCAVILACATTLATWRLRDTRTGRLGFVGVVALALSAVWVAALLLTSGPGYLTGLVPAGFAAGLDVTRLIGVSLALTALGVGIAVWTRRRGLEEYGLATDAGITLALMGAALPVIAASLYLGCNVVACGP